MMSCQQDNQGYALSDLAERLRVLELRLPGGGLESSRSDQDTDLRAALDEALKKVERLEDEVRELKNRPPAVGAVSSGVEDDDMLVVPKPVSAEDVTGNDKGEPQYTYRDMNLEPSVWDSALLIGMTNQHGARLLRPKSAWMMAVLVLGNVTMQLMFVIGIAEISVSNTKTFDDTTMSGIQRWRLYTGHLYDNVDMNTLVTKAEDSCNMAVHNRVGGTYEDVEEYLGWSPQNVFGASISGKYLSTLAIMVWVLNMTCELRRVVETAWALINLEGPGGSNDHIIGIMEHDENYVGTMSRPVKGILIVVVLVPRTLVAIFLMYFGIEFLSATVALTDIILNAVALEFVKMVDELIFSAIASHVLHDKIKSTFIRTKVEVTRLQEFRSTEAFGQLIRITFVLAVTLAFSATFVSDTWDNAQNVHDLICGGKLDFTFVTSPVSGLPIFSAINLTDHSSLETFQCFYATHAEMLAYRAGLDLSYSTKDSDIEKLIMGDSSVCASDDERNLNSTARLSNCPEYRFQNLGTMSALSGTEYYTSGYCEDQDVSLLVLQKTCLNTTWSHQKPWFENRNTCQAFAGLCTCEQSSTPAPAPAGPPPGRRLEHQQRRLTDITVTASSNTECTAIADYPQAEELGISYDWILVLQNLCPQACGLC